VKKLCFLKSTRRGTLFERGGQKPQSIPVLDTENVKPKWSQVFPIAILIGDGKKFCTLYHDVFSG
jgi:hypothetical protein